MIAAGGPETAAAGAAALKEGGNAVDAVVAAMFEAFITEPCLTSPGGAGVATLYDTSQDRAKTFDFFAAVPGLPGSKVDSSRCDFTALEVSFGSGTTQTFHVGRGATAVPGCIPGLLKLHKQYGSIPLSILLEPARQYAENGAPVSATQAGFFDILTPLLTYTPGISKVFAPQGRIAKTGETVRSRRWAEVLSWIQKNESDPLFEGPLRESLLAEWGEPRGLLTPQDLDAYTCADRPALRVPFREHEVLLPGFPSVGGSMVGFALRLLDLVDAITEPQDPLFFISMAAALETALKARAEGPPFTETNSLEHWLSDEHVSQYKEEFLKAREAGGPGGEGTGGLVPGNTTHISVIDGAGLAVSMTTSNGESCGEVLPELGLGMNNFLGEEDINPLGWHKDPPGRRLPTMMCPTLLKMSNGDLYSLGTGGSNRIRSAVLQTILQLTDLNMTPKECVLAPRLHRERDGCWVEATGLNPDTRKKLEATYSNIRVHPEPGVFFGGVHIATHSEKNQITGAGDPRRGGVVEVVSE